MLDDREKYLLTRIMKCYGFGHDHIAERYNKELDEYRKEKMKNKAWIDIKEKCPPIGSTIFLLFKSQQIHKAIATMSSYLDDDGKSFFVSNITHWMAVDDMLPEKPLDEYDQLIEDIDRPGISYSSILKRLIKLIKKDQE